MTRIRQGSGRGAAEAVDGVDREVDGVVQDRVEIVFAQVVGRKFLTRWECPAIQSIAQNVGQK
jgi:hypothetical protein